MVSFSLVLLRSFNTMMQAGRKRLSTLPAYWVQNNTSVIIRKSSAFLCLVTPSCALPLCSIQWSSFLKLTLLGATFNHHLALNCSEIKLLKIFSDNYMKQVVWARVFCTLLSTRFIPMVSGSLYQNMVLHALLKKRKFPALSTTKPTISFSNYHIAIIHILLAKQQLQESI